MRRDLFTFFNWIETFFVHFHGLGQIKPITQAFAKYAFLDELVVRLDFRKNRWLFD